MKHIILFLAIIFFMSCEREATPLLDISDSKFEQVENEIDLRGMSSSSGILIINILDCCVTFRVNYIDPEEPFELDMGDGNILTQSNLTDLGNGIFAGNYCYDKSGSYIITLEPNFGSTPIQAFAEITDCIDVVERCVSCNAVEITSDLVSDNNGCCTYAINIVPKCDSPIPVNLSLYIDGVYTLSINPSNNVSIPVQVCDGESKLIEVKSDFGVCFSKTFECGEKSCCDDLAIFSTVTPIGNLCCLIKFEVIGDKDCYENLTFSAGGFPLPQSVTILDDGAQVICCSPNQNISFFIRDENGDVCKSTSVSSCF